MNKQELIERIEGLKNLFGNKAEYIEIDAVIELVSKLNEPQKPVVPQSVADWIEKCKSEKRRLHESLTYTPFGVNGWVSNPKNQETFARAWLDGYEVEKKKRYIVKMKGIEGHNSYLKYNKNLKHWYFGSLFIYNNDVDTRTYHV